MPLNPVNTAILTSSIAAAFLTLDAPIKAALNIHLAAPTLGVKSLYEAQKKVDDWVAAHPQEPPINVNVYKQLVWTEVSLQWADSLSKHIATDLTTILATNFSPLLSVAIDTYIKKASIFITLPIGTVTIGAGMAAMPNPVPIPLIFDKTDPIKNGGIL